MTGMRLTAGFAALLIGVIILAWNRTGRSQGRTTGAAIGCILGGLLILGNTTPTD